MPDSGQPRDAVELLRRTRIEVAPAPFVLVSLTPQSWARLLEQPELSPRPDAPFMLLRDAHEVTLLLEETDWLAMRHAARDARIESGFRLVTFNLELGWDVTGYLALVTDILARARIPIGALTAFSRDHLLIKQADLGAALAALSPHVAELC
ncbi:MAG TPA: ACT domain-containing protein [Pyrinomonadaceae bacterium]|nr:ACT domain-containing protein [Pyrinomonadaceae bacterium]